MSTHALPNHSGTFADAYAAKGVLANTALVMGGTALTAVMAQIAIPLWPVPITGQTLAVLLVGSTLGPLRGALSMLLYLVIGAAGVPVFSDATSGVAAVVGPTGGYIIGFIFAAAMTGWLARRSWDKKFVGAILSFLGGTVVVFVFGLIWLSISTGADIAQTLQWGLYPFIPGGIAKALIAASIMPAAWKAADRVSRGS